MKSFFNNAILLVDILFFLVPSSFDFLEIFQ